MPTSQCPMGGERCPEDICDCFIEQFPDNPLGLHPELYTVITNNILTCGCGFTARNDLVGRAVMDAHKKDHEKGGK